MVFSVAVNCLSVMVLWMVYSMSSYSPLAVVQTGRMFSGDPDSPLVLGLIRRTEPTEALNNSSVVVLYAHGPLPVNETWYCLGG